MKAIALRTEYLENPVAIDTAEPRLFWKCQAAGQNCRQTAYRIVAASAGNATPLWDTGKVESSRMTHIPYEGLPLLSRDRVSWHVLLWDETDTVGDWSEPASFEMGLLNESDWSAHWITASFCPDKKKSYPADYFMKSFSLTKAVSKARLYVTACGLYVAHINGQRVGKDCFAPGYTEYHKHIQYQTYDVKDILKPDGNEIVIAVGDGWFRGTLGGRNMNHVFGTETKLLAQLEIVYEDGTTETIASDESFLWSNDGPIRENDLSDGEVYDANRKLTFWDNAKLTKCDAILVCSNNVPVREMERFPAKLMITPKGEKVLGFAQNIAGYVELKAPAKPGHTIILRHGETLDDKGNFSQTNFQMSPNPKKPIKQQVTYICSAQPQIFKPSFAVMGFQYVLVENWPDELNPEDFEAVAVYSAMEETGDFHCSNAQINQLVKSTRWSMKSNFLDVPTDCPQRERNPFTGDAQVFFETGSMLMNIAPFMRKWLHDIADAQKKDGMVRNLAPASGEDPINKMMDGSVGWADAIVLIPYRFYNIYGDVQILKAFYPAMRQYAEFMIRRTTKPSISSLFKKNPYRKYTYETGRHWGEWTEPKDEKFEGALALGLPRPEEATAYLGYTMAIMTKIAERLGNTEDAERYSEYATGARKAYNYLFVKDDDIKSTRPAKLVRPLALGLLDEPVKTIVSSRLARLMEKRQYTVGTGFLSTPFLLKTLSDNGYSEIAYKTLLQEKAPGWLYQMKQGATTIWENWEGLDQNGLGSLNHYSKGSVCYWLFNTVAGIETNGEEPAFIIRPLISSEINDVTAEYKSIYGKVKSGWGSQTKHT